MSPEQETKAAACPNCQKPAIRSGNEIACEICDAVFVITKKEGAKLKQVGAFDDLRNRMDRFEERFPEEKQPPDQQFVEDHPEPTAMDEEEPIL